MAVISRSTDALVIRVVYDGPPMAGKTTSVRTLAGKLGGEVHAPEEIDGRTLYFDWLDYTGGLFEGRRIRCQIISVPGQATLASRRRRLLESADVVVFVSDSTSAAIDQTATYLAGLQRVLANVPGPPIGIVVQANKRDCPDAVSLSDIGLRLEQADTRAVVIESIATEGVGIREAFVFAVRLALDRVRELMRTQQLTTSDPSIDSAEALLEDMRDNEGDALAHIASSGLSHIKLNEVRAPSIAENGLSEILRAESVTAVDVPAVVNSPWMEVQTSPMLPHENLPGGMIWPPVEGRMTLHDIANCRVNLRESNGDWLGRIGDKWILHAPATARFDDLLKGRHAILQWARLHSACQKLFLGNRCIALAPDGQGTYRLWQIVAQTPALRDQIEFAMRVGITSMLSSLVDAAALLQRAHRDWIGDASELPITLTTVTEANNFPRFVGLMPYPIQLGVAVRETIDWPQVIEQDLTATLEDIRRLRDQHTHDDVRHSLLPRHLRTQPAGDVIEQFLQRL